MKTIDEDDDIVIHKPRKLSTAEKNELLKRMIARLRINDRVELFGCQIGTARYLGTVETDGNENAIFKVYPYTLISVHVDNPNGSNEELVTVNYLDRVRLQGGRTGVEYIRLELDQFNTLATSGIFKGKEYFAVHPNKGTFIDKSQIVANLGSFIAMSKDLTLPNSYNGELAQGKIVKTKYYGKGRIMFIGLIDFSDGEIIGLELDHWWPNGAVQEKEYFKCKPGHAYFCLRKDIERVLNEISENRGKEEKEEDEFQNYLNLRQMPAMRDRVQVFDGQTGIVEFIGTVEFDELGFIVVFFLLLFIKKKFEIKNYIWVEEIGLKQDLADELLLREKAELIASMTVIPGVFDLYSTRFQFLHHEVHPTEKVIGNESIIVCCELSFSVGPVESASQAHCKRDNAKGDEEQEREREQEPDGDESNLSRNGGDKSKSSGKATKSKRDVCCALELYFKDDTS
ncbi:hypothetical protein RFI_01180 [Reticulomyxa filosa]|uniref:CAP-Gly domain-containing protein n=1 Tax=Reticulomyxa filosa TaxID=46433 RepID=X6PE05_RETFI|nr:hypothetical protein RFI_01180 [Reticulomyxa filosa]|eukprot:ETO35882.1 hypothetical protein RFI_01180 [Reticulomyxa filosa]